MAVGQLGAHIVAAVTTDQKPGQQRHVAAGPAVALGLVDLQHGLHLDPLLAGNHAGVLAHGYDPFLHGTDLVRLSGTLQGAVVGHDTVRAVKIRFFRKQVNAVFRQISVGCLVGDHIDRVGQNALDGKTGEVLAPFGGVPFLQKKGIHFGEGAGFQKLFKNQLDKADLLRDDLQLAGFADFTVHSHVGYAFGFIAGGRGAAQPAPGLGQLVHIVPDALGNCLSFKLREHGGNIHHGPSHGGGGVELLPDGDEVNVPVAQVFDELCKVADVAADAVQPVYHNGGKLRFLGVLHHFLELRPLQIPAGKALVFIDQRRVRLFLTKMDSNVLAAQLNLIFNALALAGKLGLAGVDDKLFGFLFHKRTSRVYDMLIDISYHKGIYLKRSQETDSQIFLLQKQVVAFRQILWRFPRVLSRRNGDKMERRMISHPTHARRYRKENQLF